MSPSRTADVGHHRVLERRRLVGHAHPQVAEPLADVRLVQPVLLPADIGHLGQVGRGDQLAVEIVGPGMVGALERALAGAAVLTADPGAAVPADVEEGPRLTLAVAAEDEALPPDLHRLEVAWLGQVAAPGGAEPHLLEDLLLLLGEHLRRGVGVARAGCAAGCRRWSPRRARGSTGSGCGLCSVRVMRRLLRRGAGTGVTRRRRTAANCRGWSRARTATGSAPLR